MGRQVGESCISFKKSRTVGDGPHWLDSLMVKSSSEPEGYRKHQAASANGWGKGKSSTWRRRTQRIGTQGQSRSPKSFTRPWPHCQGRFNIGQIIDYIRNKWLKCMGIEPAHQGFSPIHRRFIRLFLILRRHFIQHLQQSQSLSLLRKATALQKRSRDEMIVFGKSFRTWKNNSILSMNTTSSLLVFIETSLFVEKKARENWTLCLVKIFLKSVKSYPYWVKTSIFGRDDRRHKPWMWTWFIEQIRVQNTTEAF